MLNLKRGDHGQSIGGNLSPKGDDGLEGARDLFECPVKRHCSSCLQLLQGGQGKIGSYWY